MEKPKLVERFADNGEHSHWELLHPDTGDLLWSEETYCSSDIPKAFAKHEFRGYIGGRMLIFPISPEYIEAFDKATREYPVTHEEAFTNAPFGIEPSLSVNEIIALQKKIMNELSIPATMPPKLAEGVRKRFDELELFNPVDLNFEELHPEPKKKTYKEPPWKFNKPHNHTSEPYGKSNRSGRTARKRKNHRNK